MSEFSGYMPAIVGIVNSDRNFEKMFKGYGWKVKQIHDRNDLHGVDMVLFTGGSDISPELYGAKRNPLTGPCDGWRDQFERGIFQTCHEQYIPMLGVCRGSQFLCAMNGGRLKQDVSNHAIWGTHKMVTASGLELDVTSTHHQMMQPNESGIVLGWAEGLSDHYEEEETGVNIPTDVENFEPEVVIWENTMSLGFQYHPEYMPLDAPAVEFFFQTIEDQYDNGTF